MINNRQSGRRRGRGGGNSQRPQGGGGGGRPDNGNRIDNRARGNAAQLLEKYKNLAADAQRQGDRVNTEYYLQFADHYFRVLSETRARQEEAQGQQSQQRRPQPADPFRDQFGEFEGDEDFADEGDAIRPGEQMMAQQPDRGGEQRPDRRDDRVSEARAERRDDRGGEQRAERPERRDDRNGEPRREVARPRFDRERAEQPRYRQPRAADGQDSYAQGEEQQGRGEQHGRSEQQERRVEPAQPVQAAPAVESEPAVAEAPRRRGRPRRVEAPVEAAPAVDDGLRPGVEGLPPAIGLPAVANDAGEEPAEAPKPRRRRTVRAAEAPAAE